MIVRCENRPQTPPEVHSTTAILFSSQLVTTTGLFPRSLSNKRDLQRFSRLTFQTDSSPSECLALLRTGWCGRFIPEPGGGDGVSPARLRFIHARQLLYHGQRRFACIRGIHCRQRHSSPRTIRFLARLVRFQQIENTDHLSKHHLELTRSFLDSLR